MSRIAVIRRLIRNLRRRRAVLRWCNGLAAFVTIAICLWLSLFLLDFMFHLTVTQRLVVMCAGFGAATYAWHRFCRPFFGHGELDLQVALKIERLHGINSDLVAALQFDSSHSSRFGSSPLLAAVVKRAAQMESLIQLPDAESIRTLRMRFSLLAGLCLVFLLFVSLGQAHQAAFMKRLMLQPSEYPSATGIRQIWINGQQVADSPGMRLLDCEGVETAELRIAVVCSGQPVTRGVWSIRGTRQRDIELHLLSLEARQERLHEARTMISAAQRTPGPYTHRLWRDQLAALICLDLPWVTERLNNLADPIDLPALGQLDRTIADALDDWDFISKDETVLVGQIDEMRSSFDFRVVAGDATSPTGTVQRIALPVIEVLTQVTPPEYVPAFDEPAADHSAAIPAGSDVTLSVHTVNNRLAMAYATMRNADQQETDDVRFDLQQQDSVGERWQLPSNDTPLSGIQSSVEVDVQVVDVHGLSLPYTSRRTLQVIPDQPPSGSITSIHRVVTELATPVVTVSLTDDYGVAKAAVVLECLRTDKESGESVRINRTSQELDFDGSPLRENRMPHSQEVTLDLSSLQLQIGDQLRVTLEATDYRGELAGRVWRSEPLVWRVGDESAILGDILQQDAELEQRLQRIIDEELQIREER